MTRYSHHLSSSQASHAALFNAEFADQEQLFRSIYDGVEYIIFVIDVTPDRELRYVGWNRAAEVAVGLSSSELMSSTPEDILGEHHGKQLRDRILQCVELQHSLTYEIHLTFQDQPCWWLTTLNPLENPKGDRVRVVGTTIDITDRKETELALQEKEAFLQLILDNIPQQIFWKDRNSVFLGCNHNWATMAKVGTPAAVIGKTDYDLCPTSEIAERYQARDRQVMKLGVPQVHDIEHKVCLDGKEVWLDVSRIPIANSSGEIIGILGAVENITERKVAERAVKESEAQLRSQTQALRTALTELQSTQSKLVQSEKMSALGQLIAGIAHEINNPIGFIYSNINPAQQYINDLLDILDAYQKTYSHPPDDLANLLEDIDVEFVRADLPKLLSSMEVGAERIRDIVRSLRNFSRLDEADIKAVDLHEGIESTLLILMHRFKATNARSPIQLFKHYGTLPSVHCFAGQLNQVIMNLLSNAIDAVEERLLTTSQPDYVPTIAIQTTLIDCNWVKISITDNGIGMTPETQHRLFDPFFTTKDPGKGTGLGLSISYQIIIERHKGALYCTSEWGQGTEFVIEIPTCQILE